MQAINCHSFEASKLAIYTDKCKTRVILRRNTKEMKSASRMMMTKTSNPVLKKRKTGKARLTGGVIETRSRHLKRMPMKTASSSQILSRCSR